MCSLLRMLEDCRYELKRSYVTMVAEHWWMDLDPFIELKYYLKGEAIETWEGMKEYAELILDFLEHALEAGTELTGAFIDEIRQILGLARGGGEVEMVNMGVESFPTE